MFWLVTSPLLSPASHYAEFLAFLGEGEESASCESRERPGSVPTATPGSLFTTWRTVEAGNGCESGRLYFRNIWGNCQANFTNPFSLI